MQTFCLVVFVPSDYANQLKQALFSAGAGNIGNYEHCCWETSGTGQFKPLPQSNPTVGSIGELEKVPELRIEFLCRSQDLENIQEALIKTHPYEQPAYFVFKNEF